MESPVEVFATIAKIVSLLTVCISAFALVAVLSQRMRDERHERRQREYEDIQAILQQIIGHPEGVLTERSRNKLSDQLEDTFSRSVRPRSYFRSNIVAPGRVGNVIKFPTRSIRQGA